MDLSSRQRELLREWVGKWRLVADLSWPLQDTVVLSIAAAGDDLVVKASTSSVHIRREIWAHEGHLKNMGGVVPRLLRADADAGILVTRYLPGDLVLGTAEAISATTYRQAGELLARFMVGMGDSGDYMPQQIEKARGLVEGAAGLAPVSQLRRARRDLDEMLPVTVPLVLTHGDYQPRNWLRGANGELLLIDFGRAAPRHWTSELPRLESRAFDDRTLRDAFFGGLGFEPAPEDAAVHHLERLGMAVGTVVWAHEIGDFEFEEEGRRMLERALDESAGSVSGVR